MENFRKILAFGFVFLFALALLFMLREYFTPIFAAIVFAIILYPVYKYLEKKTKKPIVSALIVILGLLLLILIPISALAGVLFNQVQNFDISEEKIIKYENTILDLTGVSISFSETFNQAESYIKAQARDILPEFISKTSNFLLSTFIMFFILFYLLIQKDIFLREFKNFLPFSKNGSDMLASQSSDIIKAVLIGQVLTAVIQGVLGMVSFIIAGVNGAIFWGIIMIVLSIIPMVGAFLIWVPVGLFLLLDGYLWQGIFVLAWGALVVSQIDNLIRPKLVNKFSSNIHPLETFLGIFIGLLYFGIIGIIVGPLMISIFKVVVMVFRKEYGSLK